MVLFCSISALAAIAALVLLVGQPRSTVLLHQGSSPSLLQRLPIMPMTVLGGLGGMGLAWVFSSSLVSLGVGAVVGALASRWLIANTQTDEKARAAVAHEFPLVLNFLASVVESGSPVRFAAQAVSEVCDAGNAKCLKTVLAQCDVGFSDAEAWRTLADDPVWGDVAREMARCVETGAAVGDVLRAASVRATKAAAAQATMKARSVGVSSTLPLVACFLPAFLLVGVVPIIGGLISGYMSGW